MKTTLENKFDNLLDFNEAPALGERCGTCDNCCRIARYGSDHERDFGSLGGRLILEVIHAIPESSLTIFQNDVAGEKVEDYRYRNGFSVTSVQQSIQQKRQSPSARNFSVAFFRELLTLLTTKGSIEQRSNASTAKGYLMEDQPLVTQRMRICYGGRMMLWILILCLLSSLANSAYDREDKAEVVLFEHVNRKFSKVFSLDVGDWNVQYVLDIESQEKHVIVKTLLDDGHYYDESEEADALSDSIEVSGPNFDGSKSQVLTMAYDYLKAKDWIDTGSEQLEWLTWISRFAEREALVSFYYQVLANETNRLSLADGGNWLTDESVCKWVGVYCGPLPSKALLHSGDITSDGRELKVLEPCMDRPPDDAVTSIQLPSLGLEGIIPPILTNLQYLQKLRLDHNRLKSTRESTEEHRCCFVSSRTQLFSYFHIDVKNSANRAS
jgi:hypothetical protein